MSYSGLYTESGQGALHMAGEAVCHRLCGPGYLPSLSLSLLIHETVTII